MQKNTILLMGVLMGASFLGEAIITGTGAAGDTIDVPTYKVGDYWIYNSTLMPSISEEIRYEVVDIANHQDYWNDTYECYKIIASAEFTKDLGEGPATYSMLGENYQRTTDLFRIETNMETNTSDSSGTYFEAVSGLTFAQFTGETSLFPKVLGSVFNISSNFISTVIINRNGEETILQLEEPATSQYEVSIDDTLHTITTPAGTFECVKTTSFAGTDSYNVTIVEYYSEVVGREVRREVTPEFRDFPETGIDTVDELIEYAGSSRFNIPGFSSLGVFSAIGLTVIILSKNKKNQY